MTHSTTVEDAFLEEKILAHLLINLNPGTVVVKTGFASMVKGGLIMDVINPEQARIAEEAGVSLNQSLINI